MREEARRGFGAGAAAYERGRPGYPPEAIAWLASQVDLRPGRTVLDVAAGTGKLTRDLVGTGATVLAAEPVPAMRAVLERIVPAAQVLNGTAEALPLDERTVDAIGVAQAFHWFDVPRALAEFHRVLRPGGRLALIWNRRRLDQALHQRINAIVEPFRGNSPSHQRGDWREPVASSGLFTRIGELEVPHDQVLDVEGMVDRVASTSFIAVLPSPDREDVLARIRALAEDAEPPLRLGYLTEAYVYERR